MGNEEVENGLEKGYRREFKHVEFEHKTMWAMKKLKMDWNEVAEQRLNGLNELDEFRR